MKKILIIEDDAALREILGLALEAENFRVSLALDGEQGLRMALQEKVDLIVLDLVLPAIGGLDVFRRLRERGLSTPVIMLSGKKKEEMDRVLGLELGADDYLVKPFGTKEFLARVRAVLRRGRVEAREIEEYAFGDVYLNFREHSARKGSEELKLTAKEFGLLKLLVSREGEVLSRDTILNKVWGYETYPTTRTVDTFIRHLRKKIENDPSRPEHILTVPWSGYKFKK